MIIHLLKISKIMTASFNTSFFSTPATAASGVSKKGFRSTAYNNYVVDVIDFDNEIHTFEVEASTADEASEQAAELAMSQGTQVSYCDVYCEQ
jgi:hypothetical protein